VAFMLFNFELVLWNLNTNFWSLSNIYFTELILVLPQTKEGLFLGLFMVIF
jgi:hypothetical protein